jgi:site-specific DNA-methyltransferase (adenine-specific)
VDAQLPVRAVVAGYDDDGAAQPTGAHPHHKPFGVLEPLIRELTRPGELVLDPFAGSGSIPAAALRLGRRAAGLELVPEWAERVRARLHAEQQPR